MHCLDIDWAKARMAGAEEIIKTHGNVLAGSKFAIRGYEMAKQS